MIAFHISVDGKQQIINGNLNVNVIEFLSPL